VFLCSTHWPYHHPDSYLAHHPEPDPAAAGSAAAWRRARFVESMRGFHAIADAELERLVAEPPAPLPPPEDPDVALAEILVRYLRSARFLDDLVGDWFEGIDTERDLVFFTGDHGQSFGEDGTFTHGSRLSFVQTHVPLLVAGPGVPADAIRGDTTEHTDIAPTILRRLSLAPEKLSFLHGRPLFAREVRREYATLTGVRNARRGVVLLSPRAGFSLEAAGSGSLRVVGRAGPDGSTTRTELSASEVILLETWLEDFFARVVAPAVPTRRARTATGAKAPLR